jgi:hypothetical protein
MNVKFSRQGELVSESVISQFEVDEKIILPDDYRQFLLDTNGGRTRGLLAYKNPKQELVRGIITVFYGFRVTDDKNLLDIRSIRKIFEEDIPDELLSIGGLDGGHHEVVLSVKGDIGKVYTWMYGLPSYEYADLVAESFTDFLKHITFD